MSLLSLGLIDELSLGHIDELSLGLIDELGDSLPPIH